MINEIIGAILQILVFTLIPFLVYLIKNKSINGFLEYIGLKKSTKKANYLAVFACFLLVTPILFLTLTNLEFKDLMHDPSSITGKFKQLGFGINSISILLIIAILKTSFAEEILFRGFIAKRLINSFGYKKGNIFQALIFGVLHLMIFTAITTNLFHLSIIFIFPTITAYIIGHLNEKVGNGSIIPGWIAHGLANILSYTIVGFVI